MRHIQDTIQGWVAERCKLTKEELDDRVHKKDFWCNGTEAVNEYGFADKLMGKEKKVTYYRKHDGQIIKAISDED